MAQKSIKKNTIYNSIKVVSSILFPLITFPYISRVLLPENVGKINFGLSIVSYFSLIASLGITTYAIRECSAVREDKEQLSNTASQIFTINVITTIVAYVSLFLTLLCYRRLDGYHELIVIQSLSIIANTLGADWLNSAMEDFRYITIRTVAFQFLCLVLMFLFVHKPEDYMKYAMISLVSSAGASVVNIWYRRKYCRVSFIRDFWTKVEWKRHFIPILFLFVMILAQTIFNSVDSTMLGIIHGDREVGIYSAAHKIKNVINQLVGSLLWVIMPRMSYYFAENDYEKINKLLRKVLGFNFLVGLPIIVGGLATADDIIRVAAGEQFSDAASVLRILLIGFSFSLVGGNFLGNAVLLPSKQEKYYMIVCCLTAIVNIIGNYLFIPQYGVRAAAWTTAASALTILVLLLPKVDKKIHIDKIGGLLLSPFVGCIGILAVCFFMRKIGNLWIRMTLSLVISGVVYGCLQIAFRNELMMEMIRIIKNRLYRKING